MPRPLTLTLTIAIFLGPATAAATDTEAAELASRLERWFRQSRLRAPRLDPSLAAAAVENSRAVAELSALEQRGVTEYLQFLLERHQVRDAAVLALAGRFAHPQKLWHRLLTYLGDHARAEITHYGLGLAPVEDGLAATLILVRRQVELGSLRGVVGRPLELCGLLRSSGELRALVTTPGGRVIEARPRRSGRRFCAALGRAERGRYQVELMVDGAFGPEVAALFPLFIGEEPPALPVQKVYPATPLSEGGAERDLLELLQRARRQAGLRALVPCRELHGAARLHSTEMLERGFFGHRSPWRGSLARRLAEEELPYLQASENLVLSTSPRRAHNALLASPAHRRNLLDPGLTHVGIGVAVDRARGLLYITQCFARL